MKQNDPWRLTALLLTAVATCSLVGAGCSAPTSVGDTPQIPDTASASAGIDMESIRPQVLAFCGDCHAVPPAASFAKDEWPREVARGYELYRMSERFDLNEPPKGSVVAYFQALAPEKLVFDQPHTASSALSVRFRPQVCERPADASAAAVAQILWQPASGTAAGRLLFSDMQGGNVCEIRLPAENLLPTALANLGNPAIIEPADLDGDGTSDYLVGDLGAFLPEDHDRGRVLWLHPHPERGWVQEVLAKGLGRVAHAVSGDFDGDDDLDVLVAAFGWRKTGRLLLLRREDDEDAMPRYELETIDQRHGASHLRTLDWDQDGDLDFVALISQEHEKVELFTNDGSGRFFPQTIYDAEDPAFGSSGIELVDFDDDGDFDVLLTNGDSMDSGTLKPSHGVRWLENTGQFPFQAHLLTSLPGTYRAIPVDIDADGDLDVVALAFPPLGTAPQTWPSTDLLIVLEQTVPGKFARHVLPEKEGGTALTVGDFDGDGDIDLATGAFHKGEAKNWVTVWWNEKANGQQPIHNIGS